jgi:hypothetical protein
LKDETKNTNEIEVSGEYKLKKNGKLNQDESPPQIEFFTVGRAFKDYGLPCKIKQANECAILEDLHISNSEEPRQKIKRPPPPPAPKEPSKPKKTAQQKAEDKAQEKRDTEQVKAAKVADKLKAKAEKAAEPGLLTRLHKYLTEEPKPKPVTIDLKRIPPFDLQDIPDAMDSKKLAIAAKFMRKWFAGDANYASNKDQANKGIRHDGKPYPSNMIDQTTITWNWVMSFPRIVDKANELIRDLLTTPKALKKLNEILDAYKNKNSHSYGYEYNGNTHEFNEKFAFQFISLDKEQVDKIKLFADIQKNESPDEILGALGTFQINAAVGKFWCVNYYQAGKTKGRLVTIESIFLYVKDSFDFFDKPESGSQYLGHWSHKGLHIAPVAKVDNGWISTWMEHALLMDGRSIYEKGAVMYPVSNKDFRDWREKHGQGGDFLIYSKPVEFKLKTEIKIIINL